MDEKVQKIFIPHLRGQFERGLPVLLTGAGFSLGAKNSQGIPLPSVRELKQKIWNLCFPGEVFEDSTTLQDLYETGLRRHRNALADLLTKDLTVDSGSLPKWYQRIFSLPWVRCYTLNIDDLALAVSRRFELPRPIRLISATSPETAYTSLETTLLNVIHLNGTISDIPDNVSFSQTQYAQRLARPEPWYARLVADIVSRSVVFIGTTLDEPALWQHMELRRSRGGRNLSELRPRSYLVTPKIDRARLTLLADLHIEWLSMTAEEFVEVVLDQCLDATSSGLQELAQQSPTRSKIDRIPEVSALARNPLQETEYLLGEEPIWADLQSGRAIMREFDQEIVRVLDEAHHETGNETPIVITGTAGAGKTTSLMRACLRLSASGLRVGWINKDLDITSWNLRSLMLQPDAPSVLAIDDADLLGAELAPLIRELCLIERPPLTLVAVRSSRVDRALNPARMEGISVNELVMPHLSDADIGGLLETLERENRLGILKGQPRTKQEDAFRQQAGRQLLVAMYQATSGKRFEDRPSEEFRDLEPDARYIYALVCLASSFRYDLSREDVLIATGEHTNRSLNILDQLIRRRLILSAEPGTLRARHRVIAELVRDHLQQTGEIASVLRGLGVAVATKVTPDLRRSARPWRLLRSILNHDFLIHAVGQEEARNFYGELENVLSWDSHFWLQRGSLEVEFRSLNRAENFLNQARGLAPEDALVETEQAYLAFCQAIENPRAIDAPERVSRAMLALEDLIQRRGNVDHYPYHVLGSQGLSWARRGIKNRDEKAEFLKRILKLVRNGETKHPRSKELEQLKKDVEKELLNIAVE